MIKKIQHKLGLCAVICVYVILNIHYVMGIDPTPLIKPENVDSALVADIQNATVEAKLRKEMDAFYSGLDVEAPERKFKIKSSESKIDELLQFGEIIIPEKPVKEQKNSDLRMWGEVDYTYELKEQIRNYNSLIEGYEKHLNWAKKRNNDAIVDLMNVKIKRTKTLIKECKRKLRKY